MSILVVENIENAAGENKFNSTLGTTADTSDGSTEYPYTGIPAGVKQIEVSLSSVSHNNASTNIIIQIGDSGGYETSGYTSTASNQTGSVNNTSATSFDLFDITSSGQSLSGIVHLRLLDEATNRWNAHWHLASGPTNYAGGGTKSLSGVLDRLRLTTVTGTATFDNGSMNIQYSF